MGQPKTIAGARALLFDRLVDLHPDADETERAPRILNREQLKASVRRELGRLLNTRCSLPFDQLAETERSVVNYGLPDFSSLSAQNTDHQNLIAAIIGQTIAAFEPRLREVRVEVEPIEDNRWGLWVDIKGLLVDDLFAEPVTFPVLLNSKNGVSEVA
jgi:type VI secretion system protein ImpF